MPQLMPHGCDAADGVFVVTGVLEPFYVDPVMGASAVFKGTHTSTCVVPSRCSNERPQRVSVSLIDSPMRRNASWKFAASFSGTIVR
jgi:hypothetical protein